MGGAVIFVITIASIVANLIYQFVLAPLGIDYLKTIVFFHSRYRSTGSESLRCS